MTPDATQPQAKILIVDDDANHNEGVSWRLRREGFGVVAVETGTACLDAIATTEFDAVLLDFNLGDESGVDVLRSIRNAKAPGALPVIMVTAESASEITVSALREGANDYVTKPVDLDVMVERLRTQLSLRTATRDLERRALYDQLTGLPNRTLLVDRLEGAFARCTRNAEMLAILFLDLDDFKRVNDVHGHAVGDALLASVAERIAASARKSDTVSRLAGDEFVVVMERIQNLEAVDMVAGRIERAVCRPHDIAGHSLEIGVSIGTYLWRPGDTVDLATVIELADRAMYGQKRRRKAG